MEKSFLTYKNLKFTLEFLAGGISIYLQDDLVGELYPIPHTNEVVVSLINIIDDYLDSFNG